MRQWTWPSLDERIGTRELIRVLNRRLRDLGHDVRGREDVINVKDYGAAGNGATDDAAAIQRAVTAAVTRHIGVVEFPAGIYRCGSGITVAGGILLRGIGSPSSSAGSVQAFAQLWHDFDGDFITFTDQNTSGVVGGGGIDRLALVQNYGSSGGPGCGSAVSIVAPASGTPQVWMRFTNFQIENFSYTAPWTYCFYADGTANATQLRDWFFANARMASNAGGTGGLYLSGLVNAFLTGVELNNSADLTITGSVARRSSNINLLGCSCAGTVALDYADTVLVAGGNYTDWTNTANTGSSGSPCVLLPAYSASVLTNNAGANCLFGAYNSTYGLRYDQPVTENNGVFFASMNAAGNARKRLVGLSNVDVVNVDPDGLGTQIGGATTVAGTVSPSADTTHDLGSASFRWRSIQLAPATTSRASLKVPHGTAPSSPVDGDIWTTTAGAYVRINGVTVGPLGAGGGGQSAIQFQDEGVDEGTSGGVTTVDFVGAGVTASESGGTLTVTVAGGGGGWSAISAVGL